MMPTIYIDDEVFAYLQRHATPLVDNPNTTLRRLFDLGEGRTDVADEAGRRLRKGASGLGDDERYLRGMKAKILKDGKPHKSSGIRSPRGADLNQLQTWVAEIVGSRHSGNATLIHNLRAGSRKEQLGNVTVVVEPQ